MLLGSEYSHKRPRGEPTLLGGDPILPWRFHPPKHFEGRSFSTAQVSCIIDQATEKFFGHEQTFQVNTFERFAFTPGGVRREGA